MLLSRDQILGAEDRSTRDVPVPEWGGDVRVRALSGIERDAYEAGLFQIKADGSRKLSLENARARLVSLSLIGEGGARLFTESDISALGDKSAQALERVFDVARHLSGLADGEVEEMVKDFDDAPSGSSTSD